MPSESSAADQIEALKNAADAPGANHLQIAAQLDGLASQLTAQQKAPDAVDAGQAAVQVLRAHPSTAADALPGYRYTLALYLHRLAIRLWAVQRDGDALTAARDALTGYQQAADTSGTINFSAIAAQLDGLASQLTTQQKALDAVDAGQAAVQVLRTHPSTAPYELSGYRYTLALYLHRLAIRLWAVQRDGDALTAARDALTGYQQAADTSGTINFSAIAAQLDGLASQLTTHQQAPDAVNAGQAAVHVMRAHPSTAPYELSGYRYTLALYLHRLALRLWAVQRDGDALTAARDALTGYQQAADTPGTTNFSAIAAQLDGLSSQLTARHHFGDAMDATERSASICAQHADNARLEAVVTVLAGLYARAPGLRVMRAVLAHADADLLASVLRQHGDRIVSGPGVRRGTDGVPRVVCYASNETLDLLRNEGIAVEIVADVTTSLLSRRDVNVRVNRFTDGSVPPGVGELV